MAEAKGELNGRTEPPAVLCAICLGGIASLAELVLEDGEPRHLDCHSRVADAA